MSRSNKPWEDEPDAYGWWGDDARYPCAVRRGPWGAWCGYVGVPADHPWHGKDYSASVPAGDALERKITLDEVGVLNVFMAIFRDHREGYSEIALLVRCHGGLTYADDEVPGELKDARATWWFGFDCGHAGDLMPGLRLGYEGEYRRFEFVLAACEQLAEDLAEIHTLPVREVAT